MVTSNKDAAKIWAEIEKARNVTPKDERGANDLERRIDDLMAINKKHQQQNGDLYIINSGRGADGVSGNITGGVGGVGINRYNTIAGGTTYFRDFAVYNGKSTKVF